MATIVEMGEVDEILSSEDTIKGSTQILIGCH